MSQQKSLLKFVEVVSKDPKDDQEFLDALNDKYFNVGYRESVSTIQNKIWEMKKVLPWIKAGFRVIDMVASIRATGGLPPHIAMIHLYSYGNTHCSFVYDGRGGGVFYSGKSVTSSSEGPVLTIPQGTLVPDTPVDFISRFFRDTVSRFKEQTLFTTEAPLVEKFRVKALEEMNLQHPDLQILPPPTMEQLYGNSGGGIRSTPEIILAWEAHDWKEIPRPLDDPLLIRRLYEPYTFRRQYGAILSAWDITPVEHQFMRQLLEQGQKEAV